MTYTHNKPNIVLNISTRPKYKSTQKINTKPDGHKKYNIFPLSENHYCQFMSKYNFFACFPKCRNVQTIPLPKHLRVRDLLEGKYLGKDKEICKLQSCKCSLELTHI